MQMKFILFFSLIIQTYSYSMIPFTRKDAISLISSVSLSQLSQISQLSQLSSYDTSEKPIVVIGGCGYTGSDCVRTLVNDRKIPTRVVSRNPFQLENISYPALIDYKYGDVTIPSTLPNVIKDAKAIIFSVNSRKRIKTDSDIIQTPVDVNYNGLINVAKVCIEHKIPRLIVLSAFCSDCINKDKDQGVKFDKACGLKCDVCTTKNDGERALRELYASVESSTKTNKPSYTIIKPGFLTIGEKRGVKSLEINQDYTKSGMISRLDLADVCVNSIDNKNTEMTSFTCYYKDTIQPIDVRKSLEICTGINKTIEECFFGSHFKNKKPKNMDEVLKAPIKDTLFATGNEYSGETYNEIFKKLKKDSYKNFNLYDINFGMS